PAPAARGRGRASRTRWRGAGRAGRRGACAARSRGGRSPRGDRGRRGRSSLADRWGGRWCSGVFTPRIASDHIDTSYRIDISRSRETECAAGSVTDQAVGGHRPSTGTRTVAGARRGQGGTRPGAPLHSLPMSFRPEALGAVNSNGGVVDYRLTRQAVVRQSRKGRLSRVDAWGAPPQLRAPRA